MLGLHELVITGKSEARNIVVTELSGSSSDRRVLHIDDVNGRDSEPTSCANALDKTPRISVLRQRQVAGVADLLERLFADFVAFKNFDSVENLEVLEEESTVFGGNLGGAIGGDDQVLNDLQLVLGFVEAADEHLVAAHKSGPVVEHHIDGVDRTKDLFLEDVVKAGVRLTLDFDALLEGDLGSGQVVTDFKKVVVGHLFKLEVFVKAIKLVRADDNLRVAFAHEEGSGIG